MVATFGELHCPPGWVRVRCASYPWCGHHAPMALAPLIIRWGPDTSGDMLRLCALLALRPQRRDVGRDGSVTVSPVGSRSRRVSAITALPSPGGPFFNVCCSIVAFCPDASINYCNYWTYDASKPD